MAFLGLLGPVSILIALIVLGLLSRRLGQQTAARPRYLGFFVGALLIAISIAAQLLDLIVHFPHSDPDFLWIILDNVLPAIAVTIGVIFAWRYWSWLLAERD
ncbi:MAG TPA: hypothetical protein VHD90_21030 [Phototrophicaceae bacterium]|nr:hypothetical protein [Phototrophicaceae bacterium]